MVDHVIDIEEASFVVPQQNYTHTMAHIWATYHKYNPFSHAIIYIIHACYVTRRHKTA